MITQLRPASDRPSSFWIFGSAKTATGPSIAAISCMPPIAITTVTNWRDGSRVGSTGVGVARPRVVSSSEVVPALRRREPP